MAVCAAYLLYGVVYGLVEYGCASTMGCAGLDPFSKAVSLHPSSSQTSTGSVILIRMTVGYLQPPLSPASSYVRTGCTTTMTVVIWFVVFELLPCLQYRYDTLGGSVQGPSNNRIRQTGSPIAYPLEWLWLEQQTK